MATFVTVLDCSHVHFTVQARFCLIKRYSTALSPGQCFPREQWNWLWLRDGLCGISQLAYKPITRQTILHPFLKCSYALIPDTLTDFLVLLRPFLDWHQILEKPESTWAHIKFRASQFTGWHLFANSIQMAVYLSVSLFQWLNLRQGQDGDQVI